MTMLDTAELADLRADLKTITMPDNIIIMRENSGTTDKYGHTNPTFTADGTFVGRVDPLPQQRLQNTKGARQEKTIVLWRLSLEWNADIRLSDRVIYDGRTYELIELHDDHSLHATRRGILSQIQGA